MAITSNSNNANLMNFVPKKMKEANLSRNLTNDSDKGSDESNNFNSFLRV